MKQPPILYQFNYPGIIYSDNNPPDKTDNIKTSGCGIVSAAMMLQGFGIKATIQELADLSLKNHFRVSSGTDWGFFPCIAKKYNLTLKQTDDEAEVIKALKSGNLVICSMAPGLFTKHGHFILAYDTDGINFIVNDPNSSKRTGRGFSIKDIFAKQTKEYFIFSKNDITVDDAQDYYFNEGTPTNKFDMLLIKSLQILRIKAFTVEGAILEWSLRKLKDGTPVIGDKQGMIDDLTAWKKDKNHKISQARIDGFLIKSVKYLKEEKQK